MPESYSGQYIGFPNRERGFDSRLWLHRSISGAFFHSTCAFSRRQGAATSSSSASAVVMQW